jgi:hypothetical protein
MGTPARQRGSSASALFSGFKERADRASDEVYTGRIKLD